jgi:hypothetical protein
MPRGKPGTGPFARKRLQHAITQLEDTYMRLPLTEKETRVVYEWMTELLAKRLGQDGSFEVQNVMYRITEHVAALQLGLPMKMPPHLYADAQPMRGGASRRGSGTGGPSRTGRGGRPRA